METGGAGETEFYRRSAWRGRYMNYECKLCAYATLEPTRMQAHLRAAHNIGGQSATAATAEPEPDNQNQDDSGE